MDIAGLKHTACKAIDDAADSLHGLSKQIWSHPELGYQETFAHDVLTKFLTDKGFQTKRSFKLDTAFRATYTNDPTVTSPNVAFISEYDALPNIGHACGHNLIAEVGVAAGIGLRAAIMAYGKPCGQVTVIGTPAEEGFGGKVDMIQAGAFDGVDTVMMAHPFPETDPVPIMLAREKVTYHGKSSHAAGFPWEGINALDAAVMCYNGISCLRQQIKPSHRIHCIMREGGVRINIIPEKAVLELCVRAPTDREMKQLKQRVLDCVTAAASATGCIMREGGIRINIIPEKAVLELCVRAPTDREMKQLKQRVLDCVKATATATGCIMREGGIRINIIPEKAVLELCVRAPTDREMKQLKQRVLDCVKAAATATGFTVEHETMDKVYSSVMHNKVLTSLYEANVKPMLTDEIPRARAQICASTDFGNVTHIVPGIHPHFYIGGKEVNHTRGFTTDAGDVRAQRFTLDQAKALAMTGIDVMFQRNVMKDVKDEFEKEILLET